MKFSPFWKIAALIVTQATLSPVLAAPASGGGYTVKSGDTFAKIARAKGVSLSALLKANRVSNPDRIAQGQRIVIPGAATSTKATAKTETKTSSKTSKTVAKTTTRTEPVKSTTRREVNTTVNITPPSPAGTYTVQSGDTLSRISTRTGVSRSQLMAMNGLTEDSTLRIGQSLRTSSRTPVKKTPAIEQPAIADERQSPATSGQTTTINHRIKDGETFTSLTRRYGVTQSQLIAANRGVDPHRLRAGQNILVPGQSVSAQPKQLTVREDGRMLAEQRDPLDPGYLPEQSVSITQRTRLGYQVEKGDSLTEIARRFNTTPQYIRDLNHMSANEDVWVGRYILVPFTPRNPDAAPAGRREEA